MHPILLTLGSMEVRSYGAVLFLAIVFGGALFLREGRRVGFPKLHLFLFCVGAIIFGFLGGRVNAWLFHPGSAPSWQNLNPVSLSGGLTSFGSIIGFLAFGLMYARWQNWGVGGFTDVAAPIIPLVEGIMRWGCLLNGCCYGQQTEGFLRVYLPDASGHWAYRYPTQIMTSFLCLGLFIWLWRKRSNRLFEGELILLYLVIYHVGRFALDLFRGDQRLITGLLTSHQLVSLAFVIVAVAILTLKMETDRSRLNRG